MTDTKLIIPKILIFRRIYRKVHEPGGSLKQQEKSSKSLIIRHYQGFLFFWQIAKIAVARILSVDKSWD